MEKTKFSFLTKSAQARKGKWHLAILLLEVLVSFVKI